MAFLETILKTSMILLLKLNHNRIPTYEHIQLRISWVSSHNEMGEYLQFHVRDYPTDRLSGESSQQICVRGNFSYQTTAIIQNNGHLSKRLAIY